MAEAVDQPEHKGGKPFIEQNPGVELQAIEQFLLWQYSEKQWKQGKCKTCLDTESRP